MPKDSSDGWPVPWQANHSWNNDKEGGWLGNFADSFSIPDNVKKQISMWKDSIDKK